MKKVIVISGGSDGLGKEVAQVLTPNNSVIILSPTKTKLERASKELECDYQVCDVADKVSVQTAIRSIIKKYNRVDCLINCAAVWIQGELDENNYEQIDYAIRVNTTGVLFLTKAIIPSMKQQKSGLIINVISQAGLYGKAERSVYTTSKFAITGLTKSLQPELSKYGVRVTGLYPGKMNTKMFEKMGIKKDMIDALDPKEVARTIEFILSCNETTVFPEVGIKHIDN
jgi:short-subunit dehydrogenase